MLVPPLPAAGPPTLSVGSKTRMSTYYEIDPHQRCAFLRFEGAIDDELLAATFRALYEDPRHLPGYDELSDLRGADVIRLTGGGLRQLAELVESRLQGRCDGFRSAIVAPADLSFGMARVYEAHAADPLERVMVFRELEQAHAWLGVEPPASWRRSESG